MGTQPQAHGCGRRKGSGLEDLALPITNQETEAGDQSASFEMSELVKLTHRVTIRCLWKAPSCAEMLSIQPPRSRSELSKGGHFLKGSRPSTRSKLPFSVFIASPQKTSCWLSVQGALEEKAPGWEAQDQGSSLVSTVPPHAALLLSTCRHESGLLGQLCLAPRGWTSVPS